MPLRFRFVRVRIFKVKSLPKMIRIAQRIMAAERPQLKTFHATMLVTRAEQWWVEAATLEEAQALLASGAGHHAALGECVHVELDGLVEGAGEA